MAAREPPFLSRAAAARVREARRDATEAADDGLFFPFDPCRLPRTKAAVAALFREAEKHTARSLAATKAIGNTVFALMNHDVYDASLAGLSFSVDAS